LKIWIADLNPQIGTEPGKTRPVLVIQTDLLNSVGHPSTIVCPLTSKVKKSSKILRVHIPRGVANVNQDCDIMIDQILVIDNKRLTKWIGQLPMARILEVKSSLKVVFDLE
jgi:mRNA interferase MazF